jgi:hypothetical protein
VKENRTKRKWFVSVDGPGRREKRNRKIKPYKSEASCRLRRSLGTKEISFETCELQHISSGEPNLPVESAYGRGGVGKRGSLDAPLSQVVHVQNI